MPKKKNGAITTDDLADMIARGFESVDKRFESVDKKLEKHEKNISEIKNSLKEMRVGLSDLSARATKIDYKVEDVYDTLKDFEEGSILDLQRRVRILEKVIKNAARHS